MPSPTSPTSSKGVQWSIKRLNTRVRALAVLFTSETTRAGLLGAEVAVARDIMADRHVRELGQGTGVRGQGQRRI